MTQLRRLLVAAALIAVSTGLGNAQIGVIWGSANSPLSCIVTAANTPELRPEGYTEPLGDLLIACTGGPISQVGAPVLTTNIVVYLSPSVPITSRIIGDNGASEAILIIDEAGGTIPTGATGGYGPQAPQSLCTTAQQLNPAQPCMASVGTDFSGQYQVATVAGTSTPAQNVYQGKIGDFGPNSVVFYNVPVLPPAYSGVMRTFRMTNIRVPVPGGTLRGTVQATVSISKPEVLPVAGSAINLGVVGPSMAASVNTTPAGGGSPFPACIPQASPALAARVTFTEGFSTSFKTRVVAGGAANGVPNPPPASNPNYLYSAQAQNLAAPFNQNLPGGLYGGLISNSESMFIIPAASATVPGSPTQLD